MEAEVIRRSVPAPSPFPPGFLPRFRHAHVQDLHRRPQGSREPRLPHPPGQQRLVVLERRGLRPLPPRLPHPLPRARVQPGAPPLPRRAGAPRGALRRRLVPRAHEVRRGPVREGGADLEALEGPRRDAPPRDRLLLDGVRPARVRAHLLRRPRHPRRRPPQERLRPRHPARRHRPLLPRGLLRAGDQRHRLAGRGLPGERRAPPPRLALPARGGRPAAPAGGPARRGPAALHRVEDRRRPHPAHPPRHQHPREPARAARRSCSASAACAPSSRSASRSPART